MKDWWWDNYQYYDFCPHCCSWSKGQMGFRCGACRRYIGECFFVPWFFDVVEGNSTVSDYSTWRFCIVLLMKCVMTSGLSVEVIKFRLLLSARGV